MTKNVFYIVLIIVLIIGAGYFMIGGDASSANTEKGNAQVVKLSVQGGSYVLSPNEIRQGIPVKITADISKLPGCSRSIVIPAFGVSKTFTNLDNSVQFTPDKIGTFNIACSMNMYRGTFTVK